MCPRQTNTDDCSLYALNNCKWLIENMTKDTSPEHIARYLPRYNYKYALRDRAEFKCYIEKLFKIVDCSLEDELEVSRLEDTIINCNMRYFLVNWKTSADSNERSWEPMTNLYCPLLIINFFSKKNIHIPSDVKSYLGRFTTNQDLEDTNQQGCYRRYNLKKLIGSRLSLAETNMIPVPHINSLLPQPRVFIKDWGVTYELVYPTQFIIAETPYHNGRQINCFGAALKHIWNIDYNVPMIEKENMCKTLNQLTGCHLVELRHFNGNKVRNINKNNRKRRYKCFKENHEHKYVPVKKIDYWRIFEVNAGCLLLECSIRSNGSYNHLLVLNFANNYLYEGGYKYLPFEGGGKFDKDWALKILSTFGIADIKTVWLVTRPTKTEGIQTQSVYGKLKLPQHCI